VRAARTSRHFAPRYHHVKDGVPLIFHGPPVDDVIGASAGAECTAGRPSLSSRESARIVPLRGDVHEI
jgi:hypothetical protein